MELRNMALAIFRRIWPYLKNKYVVTISVFTIWMLFIDQNNVVDQVKMSREIKQMEADREYYLEQIQTDSARLHELTTDRDNLEKYAREQYLMKKKDEDVFLVVRDR
jgi:cell division protein FtsB